MKGNLIREYLHFMFFSTDNFPTDSNQQRTISRRSCFFFQRFLGEQVGWFSQEKIPPEPRMGWGFPWGPWGRLRSFGWVFLRSFGWIIWIQEVDMYGWWHWTFASYDQILHTKWDLAFFIFGKMVGSERIWERIFWESFFFKIYSTCW